VIVSKHRVHPIHRLSIGSDAGIDGILVLARQQQGSTFLPGGREGREGGREGGREK